MLEKTPVNDDMKGDTVEPFTCARWSMEAVRRMSSWEVMGGEGPVLDCPDPQAWVDEIQEWAKEATAQRAEVMGEVVIKESKECRVWKSKREEKKQAIEISPES